MEIPTQNANSKYSKTKNYTKKIQKLKKNKFISGGLKSKSFMKCTPPKVEILIQNTFLNFSITKN